MRINYGPGYRVYFWQYGDILLVLLAGGDKGLPKAGHSYGNRTSA
jgi:putative addiction module killer protein